MLFLRALQLKKEFPFRCFYQLEHTIFGIEIFFGTGIRILISPHLSFNYFRFLPIRSKKWPGIGRFLGFRKVCTSSVNFSEHLQPNEAKIQKCTTISAERLIFYGLYSDGIKIGEKLTPVGGLNKREKIKF